MLYGDQADALEAAARAEVGRLLKRRAVQPGISRQQLAHQLGFQNPVKGLRRIDAVFAGDTPGDWRDTIAERVQAADEVTGIIEEAAERIRALKAKTHAERELLGRHRRHLLDQAVRIAADEALRLALPCERASVGLALVGGAFLPLGTLLEHWSTQRSPPAAERFYVVGRSVSLLSGRGNLGGFEEESPQFVSRRLDSRLAIDLLRHPLVEPFQRRLRRGTVLRIAEVLARLP